VDEGRATGALAPIYDAAMERAGRVFGILRVMSLQPEVLRASMAFYMATTTHPRSPIPRWFRELIAVQVSRLNDCFY
jgi:alkylhydroperoxidase family enzyme